MANSDIVTTAPLYGINLKVVAPVLPSDEPAPVRNAPDDQLDKDGTLATEPGAERTLALWKDIADYMVPPLLDPMRADLAGERERLAGESVAIVTKLQEAAEQNGNRDRGFQRKTLYATTTAEFRVPANIPRELQAGPFRPGARHRAIVRFSSASSALQSDLVKDQRAVGIRITDDAGHVQDLTFTSGAAGNHARDARQFNSSMSAALDMADGSLRGRIKGLLGLLRREGIGETRRLSRARKGAIDAEVSLAAMSYYSRSPFELGKKLVHLSLVPLEGTAKRLAYEARGARDGLGRDLCMRRSEGDIRFRIVAREAPGLDDMSIAPVSPAVTIGEITLPRQRTSEAEMLKVASLIHQELAMHPFNLWEKGALTPRGELNEILRRPVYSNSARNSGRIDSPPQTPQHGL